MYICIQVTIETFHSDKQQIVINQQLCFSETPEPTEQLNDKNQAEYPPADLSAEFTCRVFTKFKFFIDIYIHQMKSNTDFSIKVPIVSIITEI